MSAIIETLKNQSDYSFTPNCCKCIHYLGLLSCKAFKKIPKNIANNLVKHDKPLSEQIGNYIFVAKQG